MKEGWQKYFQIFPDYLIEIENILENGDNVGIFGTASGSYVTSGNQRSEWKIPAAWRAVIRKEKVKHWQVYADNEPVWKILSVKLLSGFLPGIVFRLGCFD